MQARSPPLSSEPPLTAESGASKQKSNVRTNSAGAKLTAVRQLWSWLAVPLILPKLDHYCQTRQLFTWISTTMSITRFAASDLAGLSRMHSLSALVSAVYATLDISSAILA